MWWQRTSTKVIVAIVIQNFVPAEQRLSKKKTRSKLRRTLNALLVHPKYVNQISIGVNYRRPHSYVTKVMQKMDVVLRLGQMITVQVVVSCSLGVKMVDSGRLEIGRMKAIRLSIV